MSFDIDTMDFATLLPPLRVEEYDDLVASIREHGILDPVIYWQETGELIDGFHRTQAATDLGITEYPRTVLSFPSKERAIVFVVRKHLGRRHMHLQFATQLREVTRELARRLVNIEKLTQRQAADEIGMSQSFVRDAVHGRPVSTRTQSEPSGDGEMVTLPAFQEPQRELTVGDLPDPSPPQMPEELRLRHRLMTQALYWSAQDANTVLEGWDAEPIPQIQLDAGTLFQFAKWIDGIAMALEERARYPKLRRVGS